MIVGYDFPKIEFEFMGLDLLEPNTFISDLLVVITCFLYYVIVKKKTDTTSPFFNNWKRFYLIHGITFLGGGFGHLMFNYWGVTGKLFPLLLGTGIPFFMEQAMISLLPDQKQPLWTRLSQLKLTLSIVALLLVFFLAPEDKIIGMLLIVPSANSAIGFITAAGVLGIKYAKRYTTAFYALSISILTLIPAAVLQIKKISFHQWFDRNDVSHLLIVVSLILYYVAIKGYNNYLKTT